MFVPVLLSCLASHAAVAWLRYLCYGCNDDSAGDARCMTHTGKKLVHLNYRFLRFERQLTGSSGWDASPTASAMAAAAGAAL